MGLYIIEKRNTVGAYKTLFASTNYGEILDVFENFKKENGFGLGYKEVHKNTDPKNPNILKYSKVGGTHHNIIIRIREFS